MSEQMSITELQMLWLKELGINQLWGKALKASVQQNDAAVVEPFSSSQATLPISTTSDSNATVAAPQAARPETKEKSGRLPQGKRQMLGKLREQLTQTERKKIVAAPGKTQVNSSSWQELEKEVMTYYRQWEWIHSDDEVLIGEAGQSSGLMIIEEMPSADDCMKKKTFSGEVGVLLGNILKVLSLSREDVSLTSLLKFHCRTEIEASQYEQCLPFLNAQIQWCKPKCIWLLGSRVAQPLLTPNNAQMEYLRAKEWFFPVSEALNIPVVISQHPSLVLVNGSLKQEIWEDLHKIAQHLS